MALTTDEDELDLTDEEQRRKQAATQTIGKPLAYGSMPHPLPPDVPSDMPAPEVGAASHPPDASTISGAAPYTPLAPRPQSQAFADWQAQDLAKHPANQPRYSGLTRVADTIAGMTNIGRAAEQAGEFGTQGAEAKSRRLAGNAAAEETQIKNTETEREANAKLEGEAAKTATEQTGAELQPTASGLNVMTKNVAPIVAAESRAGAQLGVQGLKNEGALDVQAQKQGSPLEQAKANLANAQADLAKFKANPDSPMYKIALEHLKLATQQYGIKLKEFGFNYEPSILSPEEQSTLPVDQSGNPVALHSPLKPNQTTVSAAQRANNVVTQLPRLTQEVKDMSAALGPGTGRWNKFWQGDVGVADPKFAHLADDMDFMASAVALAHAYGRLPSTISEKFDRMYQAGKQDPHNMLAALEVAGEWLPKIANAAKTVGEREEQAPGAPAAPHTGGIPTFGEFMKGTH